MSYPASLLLLLLLPLFPSFHRHLARPPRLWWLTFFVHVQKTYYMRSILKHPHLSDLHHQQCQQPFPFASCASVEVSNHVHFPPTPTLTSTFITHSSTVYDRTPAEVLPNTCALPGRHEREFMDTSCPRGTRRPCHWDAEGIQGCYFQPHGSAIEPSESDDSDVVQTPPEPLLLGHPIAVRFGGDVMLPSFPSQQEIQSALLFLPHAPSMPLKTKKGARRPHSQGRSHPKESRLESADGWIRSDFTVPTLHFEGCLGGF